MRPTVGVVAKLVIERQFNLENQLYGTAWRPSWLYSRAVLKAKMIVA